MKARLHHPHSPLCVGVTTASGAAFAIFLCAFI